MTEAEKFELPQEYWTLHRELFKPFHDDKQQFVHLHLHEGDLHTDDFDLFLGEEFLYAAFLSTSRSLLCFLSSYPKELEKSKAFLAATGIRTISDLLKHVEECFGDPEGQDDRLRWQAIFNLKEMQDIMASFALSEVPVEEHVDRLMKIKRKLRRMPYLDEQSQSGLAKGRLISVDAIPGTLNPRDTALLGIIGLFVGVVVHGAGEEESELMFLKKLGKLLD